jgi:hypothetical protein
MACDCIAEMNAALRERNTKIQPTIIFGTADRPGFTTVTIVTEKIAPRGKRAAVPLPSFCPFCGTAYDFAASDAEAGGSVGLVAA